MNRQLDFVAPLFVPGNRPERFAKAAASGADAIIIDLEDAVATDAKDMARAALATAAVPCPILVRVNAPSTPWYLEDLAVAARLPLAGILLPKAESAAEVDVAALRCLGKPLVLLIETARGLAEARRLATLQSVVRLAFGSIDFCADVGCDHLRDALLAARSELVLASRLAGLAPPMDGVTTSVEDPALAEDDARYARALGFGGKLCIHPRQVEAVKTGFRPSEAEAVWARKVMASDAGAVAVDGIMVDAPVRLRAKAILKRLARL